MSKLLKISLLGASLIMAACDDGGSVRLLPVTVTDTLTDGQLLARSDETIDSAIVTPLTLPADAMFTVSPALPAGLTLNPSTAVISGTPTVSSSNTEYTLSNNGDEFDTFSIAIGPTLPASVDTLDSRYSIVSLVDGAAAPVKVDLANDGRIFYTELLSGNVRIIDPTLGLLPTPFATVSIVTGVEQGLIGLALDDNFDSNGFVYLHATVPGIGGANDHAEIIRLTALGNIGTNSTVLVDDLPIANHNGGELIVDQSGHLFVGRGDIGDPATAQLTGDRAGKVLRYNTDGTVPGDNPIGGDPEWARGLRNTFAMTLNPQTGDLFGGDAGAVANDKIILLESGTNFLWGLGENEPPSVGTAGQIVQTWPESVTPTALMFHTGTNQADFQNNLFYASWNNYEINRLSLSGSQFTEVVADAEFLSFAPSGDANRPLDIVEDTDGSFIVATLGAIYRVYPTQLQ